MNNIIIGSTKKKDEPFGRVINIYTKTESEDQDDKIDS